eukprot:GHVN01069040.1.p1 GENE.GHVN01069040.1~~GHVN01069040.1.p1  ORF type:complete len:424 (-),score=35.55 GHVN01069040.1:576-1847(-)
MGWAAMVGILKRDGTYSHLCSNGDAVCDEVEVHLNKISAFSIGACSLAALPFGILASLVGPKIACPYEIVAVLGAFLCAFSEPSTASFDWLFVGFFLLSLTSAGVLLSFFHIAKLFPANSNLVVAMISTSYAGSSIVFPIYDVLHKFTFLTRKSLFLITAMYLIAFAGLGILMPLRESRVGDACFFSVWRGGFYLASETKATDSELAVGDGDQPSSNEVGGDEAGRFIVKLFAAVFSWSYFLPTIVSLFWTFCGIYYFTSAPLQIGMSTSDPSVVDSWTRALSWIAPAGVVGALFIGFVGDKWGICYGWLIEFCVGACFLTVSVIRVLEIQAISFFLYTTLQEISFALIFATYGDNLPSLAMTFGGAFISMFGGLIFAINPIISALIANNLTIHLVQYSMLCCLPVVGLWPLSWFWWGSCKRG